jgi:8-oxo-dGTP pyrophosphatase MutT (NUDIX family)
VSFETTSGPAMKPSKAAAVFLVRPRAGGPDLEVLLLRRRKDATFVSSAFVFPGGVADPDEDDLRVTAARELFEEAGILLVDEPVEPMTLAGWRARVLDGARLLDVMASAGAAFALERLKPVAHWITPSVEPRRYAAHFFVARLPDGQEASFDGRETVDQIWLTPAEALARVGELRLPPPQIRTLADLAPACVAGWDALVAEAARRACHLEPILPRLMRHAGVVTLLLPWDPEYGDPDAATGEPFEIVSWPVDHPLAGGPSRFVLEDGTWKNVAPPSTRTG